VNGIRFFGYPDIVTQLVIKKEKNKEQNIPNNFSAQDNDHRVMPTA